MPTSPYLIAGNLPFGGGNGGMFSAVGGLTAGTPSGISGAASGLAAHYNQAYQSALAMNQANYNNILKGYQETAANQANRFGKINKDYNRLGESVLGGIADVGQASRNDIADAYAAAQGQQLQSLLGAGLGNSTVTGSMQRGLTLDEQKAQIQLADTLAQLSAGYKSQLGLAGLGFRERAILANAGQSNRQLDWMNSVQAQYPDANAYGNLASMLGQAFQAQEDRAASGGSFVPTGIPSHDNGGPFGSTGYQYHPGSGGGGGGVGGWNSSGGGSSGGFSMGGGGFDPFSFEGGGNSGGSGMWGGSYFLGGQGNSGGFDFTGGGAVSNPYGLGSSGIQGGFGGVSSLGGQGFGNLGLGGSQPVVPIDTGGMMPWG